MIAARKIGTADRTLEQHIADKGDVRLPVVNDDMAGRVAGRVRDIELHAFEFEHVAVFEIAVGRDVLEAVEAVLRGAVLDLVEPELVVLVRANDRDAEAFAQFVGCAGVVEVAMREPHLPQRKSEMVECAHQRVDIAARVHKHGVLGGRVPDQRAVLLQRRYRHDADLELCFGAGGFGHVR